MDPRIPVKSSLKPQVALKKEIESFVEANRELLRFHEFQVSNTSSSQGKAFGEASQYDDEEMDIVE